MPCYFPTAWHSPVSCSVRRLHGAPLPCSLMGRPESPRPTGGPPSLGNTTGEVSRDVAAAGAQRGVAVLGHGSPKVERCRRSSRAGGRAQSSCTDRGDHRSLRTRDRERVPRARIVVGRARWPSPRGDSGRRQDHFSSHINEITGAAKSPHEDAGFHRSGRVKSLLRRSL